VTYTDTGDHEGFTTAATRHDRSLHTHMLREVLALPRRGVLPPDGRDRLQPPQRSTTTHHLYTDDDLLAAPSRVSVTTPPGKPGHPGNWRDALTAWYLASRVALHDDRALTAELQIEAVKARDQTLAHALEMRVKGINAVDGLHRLEVALDSATCQQTRQPAPPTSSTSPPVTSSAPPTALGLRTGGDDVDWIGWYQHHISRWPADTMRQAGVARLATADCQQQVQTLPEYWK
jgi:hypothetical protein